MDRKEVSEMVNGAQMICTLSTCDTDGNVNVAVFGSLKMMGGDLVTMGIGQNRSFKNLNQNPKAVLIVMEPGDTAADWKGARIYLKVDTIEEDGPFFNEVIEGIVKVAGEGVRGMLKSAVRFNITDIRPILAPV